MRQARFASGRADAGARAEQCEESFSGGLKSDAEVVLEAVKQNGCLIIESLALDCFPISGSGLRAPASGFAVVYADGKLRGCRDACASTSRLVSAVST